MRKLLILFVVLVILLVAADRISAYVAQRKIASRVAASYHFPTQPTVHIKGFPFLTQVVAGRYKEVDITLSSLTAGGMQMRDLHARFTGVNAPLNRVIGNGQGSMTADRAAATAFIPFASVQQRLPPGIKLAPDGGDLKLSGKLGYLGLDVPVSAAVSLRVSNSAIEVAPRHVTVAGGVPVVVPTELLGNRLAIAMPVRDLPMHLQIRGVRVMTGGFEVTASAQGVEFQNNG
ncbi:MAG TPA: DUF2993 domain-containing protein [Streptosporangiaceae bacterium]|nr:DUF2993 domain-containing protein [Streptosporangiaceae bacterium]